jgi:hypothetical protein
MSDATSTVPATKQQLTGESRRWSADLTPDLAVGETLVSSPVATLIDLATWTAYAAGLSGAPTLVGNVITQRVVSLVAGHVYALRFYATSSTGEIKGTVVRLECPA